jgi:hypothetical protein
MWHAERRPSVRAGQKIAPVSSGVSTRRPRLILHICKTLPGSWRLVDLFDNRWIFRYPTMGTTWARQNHIFTADIRLLALAMGLQGFPMVAMEPACALHKFPPPQCHTHRIVWYAVTTSTCDLQCRQPAKRMIGVCFDVGRPDTIVR